MQNIHEISDELKILWFKTSDLVQKVGNQAAQEKPKADKWSISEEFGHIILSAAPISKVLNTDVNEFINKDNPARESLSYSRLNKLLIDALKLPNTVAPARFTQLKNDVPSWKDMIEQWKAIGQSLTSGLMGWSEYNLDFVQLKHPLLGKLTLREMLFFTHIHTAHHLKSLEQKALILSRLD